MQTTLPFTQCSPAEKLMQMMHRFSHLICYQQQQQQQLWGKAERRHLGLISCGLENHLAAIISFSGSFRLRIMSLSGKLFLGVGLNQQVQIDIFLLCCFS